MKSTSLLENYTRERDELLQGISNQLRIDARVKAAWLFGSLGRGDADALSDIDIWVVLEDDSIGSVIANPQLFASRVGDPVLIVEAPQNAPEGGAYLMACYDAPTAPHIVDWYWQPQSLAFIPEQVHLLFNKAGLEQKNQAITFPERPASKVITGRPIHFLSFFWMMLMITAKYACREPWAEEMELLPFLIQPIEKARHFLGMEPVHQLENNPPHPLPGQKIQLLQHLAEQMKRLMAAIGEKGEEVPALVLPGIFRYLEMVELLI